MMPDAPSPDTFIVRFLTPGGETAGCGILVHSRHVITCAHVVNTALGRGQREQAKPDGPVTVEFPLLPDQAGSPPLSGEVTLWLPPSADGLCGDDIAGLILARDPPARAAPARLSAERACPGLHVSVFGYPGTPPRPDGSWVPAVVRGSVANGRLQLDSGPDAAVRVQPGFSGSPVYDDAAGRVVGMLAAAPQAALDRDSYAISADRIRRARQDILPGLRPRESPELTILHVSGTRFTGSAPIAEGPYFAQLHHDLAGLAKGHGLRPDLLVVTGDLADRGRPREFRQAFQFMSDLAEAAEIPRDHVAVVPGNHDVNRQACAAYFSEAEAGEEEPVAPFWRKWKHYAAAFEEFYESNSESPAFTPDEPFTLFEMPELSVVVAGLNSTIADSHRETDHYGYLGGSQLEWFRGKLAEYQRRGWLRVAAFHHGEPVDFANLDHELGDPKLVHLFLHDGAPHAPQRRLPSGVIALPAGSARYQIITVRPDSITRYARRYAADEHRWVGDSGISSSGPGWHECVTYHLTGVHEVFPSRENPGEPGPGLASSTGEWPAEPRRDEFLERVAEATRARFPHAIVTERPRDNYLRVSVPRDGGGTEQWPIGVIDGPPSEETVDAFAAEVHAQFTSADPFLRSELVYNAPAAPADLAERALRRGIRLKSMVEYQGLLDLTSLTAAQQNRLATDRFYPPWLYVEQHYRIVHGSGHGDQVQTGLVAQAVDWLGTEHARLVVVLGDFGHGKTAFLRQLTRVLPTRLPSVIPIMVDLRSLEKGPSLDHLLGQHLIQEGIEDFSQAKLRYMIDSGRVALLFDGFDELELRVGYDSAARYLRTLVNSVSETGQAKVILTSRTQHFRSAEQVSTAFGENVESRTTSRVVVLEEFSDEQMTEFLTRFYGGDEELARQRLDLVRGIGNLIDLAHNPRMLSFIANLDSGWLRAALDDSGQVNAAGLYEQIIGFWLKFETDRQQHVHGRPTITREERLEACTALALRLWQSNDPQLALADLSAEVTNTLSDLADRGFTREQAAHTIASGSLLVRTKDDAFTFIHQSVMEWLVAKAAASDLTILSRAPLSRLMAAFVTDLAGAEAILDWARQVPASPSASDVARNNVYTLVGERSLGVPRPGGMRLAGLDLRERDLSGHDLSHGDLRGTDLRGMRLDRVDLSGADLSDADLTGVTMTAGSLRDATLTGSTWDRAAILGTDGLADLTRNPELAAAAVPGRDLAEAMFVPPGECNDVAFSPDGTLLAVARGHAVQLIDIGRSTTRRILHGHTRQVTSVVFSPDGTLLATASRDNTARIWGTVTGTERGTLTGHDGWVAAVAFSPDSGLVATASRDRTARTWDTATGRTRTTFTGHDAPVNAVAFSPDGLLLATVSSDSTARTWDVADGAPRDTLTGHKHDVTAIAFSPDGRLLATGSRDRTARIWDAAAGTERSTIAAYPESVTAVAFSPDGALLATSHGTRAETLDTASGIRQAAFRERYLRVTGIAFSPDGALLATVSTSGAQIWDLESGVQRTAFTRSTAPVTAVAFSGDGALSTTDSTGAIHVWDTGTGVRRAVVTKAHSRAVTAVAFSPDQSLLATASRDDTIRTWVAATGGRRSTQRRANPAAVAFSRDGTLITAASFDGAVRTWNVGSQAGVLAHDFGASEAMAFSAGGAFLATASADGASVYAIPSGTTVATVPIRVDQDQVSAVALSPDGALLCVASPRGTLGVWDTRTGARVAAPAGHAMSVNSIAFSPGGTVIVTGSDDGTARTWDADTGADRAVFTGHTGQVRTVTFSADGALLATGSSDGTARVWDAGSGRTIATLISLPGGGYATLLPGGGYKLSDGTDDIWWAIKLCRFAPGELDPYVEGLRRLSLESPII